MTIKLSYQLAKPLLAAAASDSKFGIPTLPACYSRFCCAPLASWMVRLARGEPGRALEG